MKRITFVKSNEFKNPDGQMCLIVKGTKFYGFFEIDELIEITDFYTEKVSYIKILEVTTGVASDLSAKHAAAHYKYWNLFDIYQQQALIDTDSVTIIWFEVYNREEKLEESLKIASRQIAALKADNKALKSQLNKMNEWSESFLDTHLG